MVQIHKTHEKWKGKNNPPMLLKQWTNLSTCGERERERERVNLSFTFHEDMDQFYFFLKLEIGWFINLCSKYHMYMWVILASWVQTPQTMSIDDVVDRTVILNQQKHERMSNNNWKLANDCRREESLVLKLTKIRVKKNGAKLWLIGRLWT
jgi:hypothetical protein